MNETIGVKGGKNDRRRVLKITKQRKKQLQAREEELKELENKVKKQQYLTLIKIIPITLVGGTIKTIYETATNKRKNKKQDSNSKSISQKPSSSEENTNTALEDGKNKPIKKQESKIIDYEIIEEKIEKKEEKPKGYNINYDYNTSIIDEEALPDKAKKTIQKLKAHKIIETYEQELKEMRYELRNLTSDYRVLAGQEEEIVYSEDAALVLDKLSEVISRIETLKRKLQIEDLDSYDDNYIYTLIEDYLVEFKSGTVISEIKDSPLYILISEKLAELDHEKDDLSQRVTEKKENLKVQELQFEELQERYYSLEKANQELLQFQDEQDRILRDIEEKIKNATTVEERVKVEVKAMNKQSKHLLSLLALQMFLPGPRGVKRVTAATAAYLYFTNRLIKPTTTTKKYQVITVKDYASDIENNLETIIDAETLLSKTDYQIDKMIWEIKALYHDYINLIPEYSELLSHLDQIKGYIKEKEYEMDKIKQKQMLLLEKNNAKVLAR